MRGLVVLGMCIILFGRAAVLAEVQNLAPAPSPVDNPLKGLVPYAESQQGEFPHSLEFSYLALNELMKGPEIFDWRPLERLLTDVSSRGNHAVFRVWLETPGKPPGVPKYLLDQGVKLTEWRGRFDRDNYTPDYGDERLVAALERFIAALGKRYDGDPRIGFIEVGLLGEWGEWHDWPRHDLFAPAQTQRRVLDAFEKAMKTTRLLVRYPAGDEDARHAGNARRPVGYHDDSFAWDTIETGRTDKFTFMALLKAAGEEALNKWQTQLVGGEIRPEIWGQVFDDKPKLPETQDFFECVRQTHVSWLMDSGMFLEQAKPDRYERAIRLVRRMGYDFYIQSADIRRKGQTLAVQLSVTNQGVAPFYYDWKMEVAAIGADGGVLRRWPVDWRLTGLLPGDAPRIWEAELDVRDLKRKPMSLAIRVLNPLPGGKPLRFANADQDRDAKGWLSIGRFSDFFPTADAWPGPAADGKVLTEVGSALVR